MNKFLIGAGRAWLVVGVLSITTALFTLAVIHPFVGLPILITVVGGVLGGLCDGNL